MRKNQEPYYWPLSKIIEEHALIVAHTSKLSTGQRNAVKHIYKQKAAKGLLPGQKERFMEELTACHKAAAGAVKELCRSLGMDPDKVVMSNFSLVLDEPKGLEAARYLLSFSGSFLGWITVERDSNTYIAKYYAEENEALSSRELRRLGIV